MAKTNCAAESWGYLIVLSKFVILFVETGIAKSFGVLIPSMVDRLESNYATVGLICSLPPTFMYLLSLLVTFILQRVNHRFVAMSGGLMCGLSLITCAFFKTTVTVGVCLALSGVGLAMANMPSVLAVNDYFREDFVFWSTVASYGYAAGSMLLPIVIERSLQAYGYEGAFLILGGIALHLVVCGATIRGRASNGDTNANEGNNSRDEVKKRRVNGYQERLSSEGTDVVRQRNQECEKEVLKWTRMEEEEEGEQEDDICEETFLDKRRLIHKETQRNRENAKLSDSPGVTCGLLKERIFLISIPIPFLLCYVIYAWMLFLVPHAEHLGISPSTAIYLSTIGGIAGILGRTIFITLIRKGFSDLNVYIVVGLICTGSFLLDFVGSAYPVRAILAFFQGFCFFIEESVYSSLSKVAIFDENNFAMALATLNVVGGLGVSSAGLFTGYIYDVTQSFTTVFIIMGVIHGVAVINLLIVVILIKRRR
ncbi:monocarboxylate transporter 7-like isoform X1 [Lytechinus pictus]|uniref:monocarboxylate transporter 7-like isoform X1 n=1 Tax=Lytechinus pictus TaxID=7653 RepID=UPI0030B9B36E